MRRTANRAELAERRRVIKIDIQQLKEELDELDGQVADDAQALEGIWDYLDEEVKPSVMTVSNNGAAGDMTLDILEDAARVFANFQKALFHLKLHWGDLERAETELKSAEDELDQIEIDLEELLQGVSYENIDQDRL